MSFQKLDQYWLELSALHYQREAKRAQIMKLEAQIETTETRMGEVLADIREQCNQLKAANRAPELDRVIQSIALSQSTEKV
jgi:hypothetical protein